MIEKIGDNIKIKFTPEQRQQICKATGFSPASFEMKQWQLGALVLAAIAKGRDSLPISDSGTTIQRILSNAEKTLEHVDPFTLSIQLTAEQQEQFNQLTGKFISSLVLVPDEWTVTYNEQWAGNQAIRRIGRSIILVPVGTVYEPTSGDHVIQLPLSVGRDKGVFGTGEHPTTQMPLILMEEWLKGGERILDLGTGSGIQAVAAVQLGASDVLALDVDNGAVAMAQETVTINKVDEKVTVSLGSIEAISDTYDIVVANIFTGVIISLAEELAGAVRLGGLLITSGIIAARSADVIKAVSEAGFELEEQREQGGWTALLFRRAQSQREMNLTAAII